MKPQLKTCQTPFDEIIRSKKERLDFITGVVLTLDNLIGLEIFDEKFIDYLMDLAVNDKVKLEEEIHEFIGHD